MSQTLGNRDWSKEQKLIAECVYFCRILINKPRDEEIYTPCLGEGHLSECTEGRAAAFQVISRRAPCLVSGSLRFTLQVAPFKSYHDMSERPQGIVCPSGVHQVRKHDLDLDLTSPTPPDPCWSYEIVP